MKERNIKAGRTETPKSIYKWELINPNTKEAIEGGTVEYPGTRADCKGRVHAELLGEYGAQLSELRIVLHAIEGEYNELRRYAPQEKYDAKNTRRISLKLNTKTDADILAYLESAESIQGAIKEAIRDKIGKM